MPAGRWFTGHTAVGILAAADLTAEDVVLIPADAAAAHRALETRGTTGKVVLLP